MYLASSLILENNNLSNLIEQLYLLYNGIINMIFSERNKRQTLISKLKEQKLLEKQTEYEEILFIQKIKE